MKLTKIIGIGAGLLVGAIVLAGGLFVAFFPKDLAAREAERRIEEATGRELTLGDEISISFWPALGFSVNDASLSNPEGFSAEEPFIAADRIVFAVKVMPLLRDPMPVAGASAVLDLRGLRLVDSRGVRTLFHLHRQLRDAATLDVLMPTGQPRVVLERLGLSERLGQRRVAA